VPLQNRVTPFGEIVAIPQRGMFTGNRGIIHDPRTRTLLSRRWATKAWIVCVCEYKGVRRDVMGGRSWTELFFLDEATALAAGHRPCFFAAAQRPRAFVPPGPRAMAASDRMRLGSTRRFIASGWRTGASACILYPHRSTNCRMAWWSRPRPQAT